MQEIRVQELVVKNRVILIDAYGVLVTSRTALPGAREFIRSLNASGKDYYIVTNDASRLPESTVAFYRSHGLDIPVERILTAGMAIEDAFRARQMSQPRCAVLGTGDSHEYVRRAGGTSVEIHADSDFDAVVIADDSGFDVITTMNSLLTAIHRMWKHGKNPTLLLPNADLLYNSSPDSYGFTSGALARLLEMGLEQLNPDRNASFEILGKPGRLLFERALRMAQAQPHEAAMIGDQLRTDIQGANQMGIDSCLVLSGLTSWPPSHALSQVQTPTYVLRTLENS